MTAVEQQCACGGGTFHTEVCLVFRISFKMPPAAQPHGAAQASCCLRIGSESLCIHSDIEKAKTVKREDAQTLRIDTESVRLLSLEESSVLFCECARFPS